MDTLTKSCSPTIVITANGEVQTHEEAIVYVKELDIFLTLKVLENTPAVLSLGKLCEENGYSYEWIIMSLRSFTLSAFMIIVQKRPGSIRRPRLEPKLQHPPSVEAVGLQRYFELDSRAASAHLVEYYAHRNSF